MRCFRTPIEAEVQKFEFGKGLEDGYEMYMDIIVKSYVDCDNLLQIERDGRVLCPYIKTRRGKTFIKKDDYIAIEEDGTKVVCGEDKVKARYQEI